MTLAIRFKLERPAKAKGGDRYSAEIEGEDRPMVIYIPQQYSRAGGEPAKALDVMIQTV